MERDRNVKSAVICTKYVHLLFLKWAVNSCCLGNVLFDSELRGRATLTTLALKIPPVLSRYRSMSSVSYTFFVFCTAGAEI